MSQALAKKSKYRDEPLISCYFVCFVQFVDRSYAA